MTGCIGDVYAKNDTKLSWLIGSGVVYDEKKTGQWCDRLYQCGLNAKTELSEPILPGTICDDNQIRQRFDWLHRCGLHRNRNWTVRTDRTKCGILLKPYKTMT